MTIPAKEKSTALFLTTFVFAVYVVHAFMFDGSYGGGDGIRHYLVSKWSWQHPEQFFYHWGKPFFTLISSPFSQFGLIGIKIFNAVLGALTALLGYFVARKFNISQPLAAVIFTAFTPVYLMCINSGLTEPMFAFQLMLCVWLFLENRYVAGTLILSFLPFVRSEGNLMFPLFALVLLYRGKWMLLPLLAFGTVAYSIAGYFHYKDIFWIKTKNPYTGHNYDIYGHGELWHFVNAYKLILGLPLTIIFVAGVIYMIYKLASKRLKLFSPEQLHFEELILIYGSFFVYFIAHSVFWWKGLFGSLGLERSIAGVVPCAGLIALRGLDFMTTSISGRKMITNIIYILFALWIIIYPVLRKDVPLKIDREELVVKEAGEWYNQSEYKNEKVYYLYPYFMHILKLDAFNGNRVGELWGLYNEINEWGIDVIPLNTVILWDAHFGANEAYIPFEKIMSDPNFKHVKSFKPEQPFTTLGGYNFEIHAFVKVKSRELVTLKNLKFDLEDKTGLENTHTITGEKAFSGTMSSHMTPGDEYGILFAKDLGNIENSADFSKIVYSFKMYADEPVTDVLAVMSVDDQDKNIQWTGKEVVLSSQGKWVDISIEFILNPGVVNPQRKIGFYTWNKGGMDYYIDDIKIDFQVLNE